jgi:serine/threonine-protein kinase
MARNRQFGHYELISRLGRGGMGEVWRAKHQLLNRQAAVKLIVDKHHKGTAPASSDVIP